MKEQRRHQRVNLSQTLSELFAILSAQVTWPNQETSNIIDLSYRGLAVTRPGIFAVSAHQQMNLQIEFGKFKSFDAKVRVAWLSMDLIGLEILQVSPEGHLAMREFLDLQLTGLGLKAVGRIYFSSAQNFQYWYQAPGVNIFIWINVQGLVQQVNIDFDEQSVVLKRGQAIQALQLEERKAFLLLSQIDKSDHPMEEFLRTLKVGE